MTATSVLYRAPDVEPGPGTVTLTASSITDSSKSQFAILTISASPLLLSGKYAFLINGYRDSNLVAIAGQFTADQNGQFTGIWDANAGTTPEVGQPITGTYSIQPDGHGTMTIQAGSAISTYVLNVEPDGSAGRFAESTVPPGATTGGSSGYMVRQDTNCFTLASIQGDRVIATYGEATGSHVAALGRFTSSGQGTLYNGVMDLSWEINQNIGGRLYPVTLTGVFGMPDPTTGRGTAALNVAAQATATYNFAYYIVSDARVLLVQTDPRAFNYGLLIPTLSGEVRYQQNAGSFTNTSLNAPTIFHVTGADWWLDIGSSIGVGRMVPEASGSISVAADWNISGTMNLNVPFTSSYSVSANGRATLSWVNAIGYLIDQNTGYFITPETTGARFAAFEPQTGKPFDLASLAGTFLLNTGPPAMDDAVENDAGWMTLGSDGTANAMLYVNTGSGTSLFNLTGVATVGSNGRGTLVLNTNPPATSQEIVFWAISPDRIVAILTVTKGDIFPALLIFERTP